MQFVSILKNIPLRITKNDSAFAFSQELWNILDGRCLSLAKASNDTDYAAEDDAICELQYLLKYPDEMPVQMLCRTL